MESKTQNPLLCDIETGMCELPDPMSGASVSVVSSAKKPVRIVYYTDPICSTCWGIEPQLRRLKLEYGTSIDIEYRMGGLLPDWSYNSGGISKPSDVAHHWDEVSLHYDMPIDGDVWLEDPLPSSYPPSIAFKAAQIQSQDKAVRYLRKMREMVFLQKKNITRWPHLAEAAQAVGLDADTLKTDYERNAKTLFNEDLELGRKLGVRGFPTMFFSDNTGKQLVVYGFKPYDVYEQTIQQLHPAVEKSAASSQWHDLFSTYPSLTAREFAELSGLDRPESESTLRNLTQQGHLLEISTKNGSLWTAEKAGH